MTARVIAQPLRSTVYACIGTGNALFAFTLAAARIYMQTQVPGGYQMLAGPLGAAWWCFAAPAVIISAAAYAASFFLNSQGK